MKYFLFFLLFISACEPALAISPPTNVAVSKVFTGSSVSYLAWQGWYYTPWHSYFEPRAFTAMMYNGIFYFDLTKFSAFGTKIILPFSVGGDTTPCSNPGTIAFFVVQNWKLYFLPDRDIISNNISDDYLVYTPSSLPLGNHIAVSLSLKYQYSVLITSNTIAQVIVTSDGNNSTVKDIRLNSVPWFVNQNVNETSPGRYCGTSTAYPWMTAWYTPWYIYPSPDLVNYSSSYALDSTSITKIFTPYLDFWHRNPWWYVQKYSWNPDISMWYGTGVIEWYYLQRPFDSSPISWTAEQFNNAISDSSDLLHYMRFYYVKDRIYSTWSYTRSVLDLFSDGQFTIDTTFVDTGTGSIAWSWVVDYYSSCGRIDVGCYIKQTGTRFGDFFVEQKNKLIASVAPDISFPGNFNSCATGATSSGSLQQLANIIALINPYPPPSGTYICSIFGEYTIEYQRLIPEKNFFEVYSPWMYPALETDWRIIFGQTIPDLIVIFAMISLILYHRKND